MARRKPVVRPVQEACDDVPEELMRCHVEDWIRPGDMPPEWWMDRPNFWYQVAAWRRWRDARNAWLQEHLVPRERQGRTIPSRKPSFADWPSFAERFGLDPVTGGWADRGRGPSRR